MSKTDSKMIRSTMGTSLASRATTWKRIMTTSCARTHLLAHALQVSASSANGHREAAGAAVATAERVVTVVYEH